MALAREDADAFAAVYAAYSQPLLRFFTRRTRDAQVALDLLAETFAQALTSRHRFRGHSTEQERAWLDAIARNELGQYIRRGRVERAALARVSVDVPALDDAQIERIEDLAILRVSSTDLDSALAQLPAAQREAVELRVLAERVRAGCPRLCLTRAASLAGGAPPLDDPRPRVTGDRRSDLMDDHPELPALDAEPRGDDRGLPRLLLRDGLVGVRNESGHSRELRGAHHILFGSDFPAVDLATAEWYTRNVDAYFADRPQQLENVMRSNALALFPRLRAHA